MSLGRSWATAAHLPALAQRPEFDVVAVATRNPRSAREAAQAFGIELAFDSAQALARHPDVDLVVAATGIADHAPVVRAALANGKHVFCEWPLGVSAGEAISLCAAADAAGVTHAVGLQAVVSPSARFVRDLVADERIGRLRSVRAAVSGDGGRSSGFRFGGTNEQVAGASIATITGGHVLAALVAIVGPVASLAATVRHARADVELETAGQDWPIGAIEDVSVTGTFANGPLLSLVLNRFPPGKPGFAIELIGSTGTLTIRQDSDGPGIPSINIARWRIVESNSDGVEGGELATPLEYLIPDGGAPGSLTHNLSSVYRELARAIRGANSIAPTFKTATEVHRLIEMILTSARTGQREIATRR